jgi:hypothetical protein
MILDKDAFFAELDSLSDRNGGSLIDAVIEYCDTYGIDPEMAGALIRKSHSIKAKFKEEAISLNFLRPTDK